MLILTFKDPSELDAEVMDSPSLTFDGVYEDSWLEDDSVKYMIEEIDKTKVINCRTLESSVLGQIPVSMLSSGVKGLILMLCLPNLDEYEQEYKDIYYLSSMYGQNCFKFILDIAAVFDIKMCVDSYFYMPEVCFDRTDVKIYFEDYDYYAKNIKDADDKLIEWG